MHILPIEKKYRVCKMQVVSMGPPMCSLASFLESRCVAPMPTPLSLPSPASKSSAQGACLLNKRQHLVGSMNILQGAGDGRAFVGERGEWRDAE